MKYFIKKNRKIAVGILALVLLLTVPVAALQRTEPQEERKPAGPVLEETQTELDKAEDLLLLDTDKVNRRQDKTPGLIPELLTPPTSAAAPSQPARTSKVPALNAQSADSRFLIALENPDPDYIGRPLLVSDRQALEGLVMGEWGNDYIGAVLVAQCIRDSMIKEGTNSAAQIKRKYGYTAPIKRSVSQTVKDAVAYVFDEGGSGVQHPIYYFYASNLVRGKWHETQQFVIQRKAVRFFAPKS